MALRRCLDCGELCNGTRCLDCARTRDAVRRPSRHLRYPPEYEANRLIALERDNYECQLRLAGCTDVATTADHITPRHLGGGHDLGNLRAACSHCNSARGAGRGGGSDT